MLSLRRFRAFATLLAAIALTAVVAGCAATGQDAGADAAPSSGSAPAADPEQDAPARTEAPSADAPTSHVHGVGINPADELVYVATHDGLYRYGPTGAERVGPVVDLMGFTVAGPDHFYSSGHPGPGVDLPQPLGLAESTDGGQTWTPLSRGGESDFHALAGSSAGVVGYDGFALRTTTDGQAWTDLDPPVDPYALATSADGRATLLTSSTGLYRSEDGMVWDNPEAPLLQYVAFAGETVAVGVTPDGVVARSDDAGTTWTQVGELADPAVALGAATDGNGGIRVVAVTENRVLESRDGGATFQPLTVA